MAKNLTPQNLYESIEKLSTTEQIALKDFVTNLLNEKKEKAAKELQLIENGGK